MSEPVENKICEGTNGTTGTSGSNLRCLYQALNKSKDINKNKQILKDILSVLTYPQSAGDKYKLRANDDVSRIYLLLEKIDETTQNKTYKIKVKGKDISLTKKTDNDKIFVSDLNEEYILTEDGLMVLHDENPYKLITTDQNGITTYKIILNNSAITLDKISTDTFVKLSNPNPAPFTCDKNVNPSTWRIPDGQFNSLINQLKTVATDNKFNFDQNNAIKKYILERSQCKYNNGLKSNISSGYKNFIYWRNNGGKKTRKYCNKQRKTRKARKTMKPRKDRKKKKYKSKKYKSKKQNYK
jgi:hypothetical protein